MITTIVDVKKDIMMLESLIVKNVTSNVPNVLMEHLVKNVLETDLIQQPSVLLVKMENMMTQFPLIVKNVQTNGAAIVYFVTPMNVSNVLKTEKHQDVIVSTDMLKSMEFVNLVTTIVMLVP
jgi:hypothetical protein